jgi:hypothetical protein
VPQRDQSTSTRSQHYNKHSHHNNHNDHAKENTKDNPWRRMVMAATSAAQERERIEQGVHPGRTTATTTSAHPPHLHQQRQQPQQQYHQQHQQQYYRSQHSQEYTTTGRGRDYSVIKDTCQELTFELRSFGAYVMAVDQQVGCVLEGGWGTFEPISFIVSGMLTHLGSFFFLSSVCNVGLSTTGVLFLVLFRWSPQCRPTIQVFVQYLQESIIQACPDAQAIPYGSYATGLWYVD